MIRIGTAGWTVPKAHASLCGDEGTHLQRYTRVLECVEVNSSFHRAHGVKTWAKWAGATPEDFRFAVKAPKSVTHDAKLVRCGLALAEFFGQVKGLGERLGPVLFQLPPKLMFDEGVAREFLATMRELHRDAAVCEPRNASWFTPEASRLLREYEVGRVAADPPKGSPLAGAPGGWSGLRYYRLHGAPRTYWSEYTAVQLEALAKELCRDTSAETWVIFDNTAQGHALRNAKELRDRLARQRQGGSLAH